MKKQTMWNIKHYRILVLSLTVSELWWVEGNSVFCYKYEKNLIYEIYERPTCKISTYLEREEKILYGGSIYIKIALFYEELQELKHWRS